VGKGTVFWGNSDPDLREEGRNRPEYRKIVMMLVTVEEKGSGDWEIFRVFIF
jgi:hypothetical protein